MVGFVRERAPDLVEGAPPAEPAPGAEPAPAAAAPPAGGGEDPADRILALVAEQTGYPPDLLDLDLDLEADLGIDTVKQAEVFAAIREAYEIPFDDALKLRDYPTLNHVVGFVRERAPDLAEGAPPAEPAPGAEAGTATRDGAARPSEEARFPRRIPVPVVRPALEHCVPTGVSLEVGRRVVVMPDQAGIGEALVSRLEKLGVEVLRADGAP